MKTFATLAMIALFAVSAFAADIAKGPAVVDGKVTQYEDSINRGDCAVIAHIDGTFTDLTIPYSDALIAAGKSPDIIYDPFGSADLSGYEGVVASAADLWWAYDFAGDEAAYAAFLDGGGALLFVGQDYIYSRGGIDGFPSDYMAILDVVE
ncbi:MAG: hypothetical protein QGG33_03600, partial [Candidatus Krumholzibacteria bacterium]|nr:hypothetical protein [Candidatus Krumholzibacteria bacterium]